MSLALQSLVVLTLLVCAGVASLPLITGAAAPRPDPGMPPGSAPALRVVEAPGGRWYLDGEPIARTALASLLGSATPPRPVEFLPSAALGVGDVAASLRWLRRVGDGGAVLVLPSRAAAAGSAEAPSAMGLAPTAEAAPPPPPQEPQP